MIWHDQTFYKDSSILAMQESVRDAINQAGIVTYEVLSLFVGGEVIIFKGLSLAYKMIRGVKILKAAKAGLKLKYTNLRKSFQFSNKVANNTAKSSKFASKGTNAAKSNSFLKGGKTFSQYKTSYWSGRIKPKLDPIINPKTGQVWKQYTELHHRFIPQRAKWAPNWLKNNRLNLTPTTSLRHAQMDPYRARFAPRWVKEMFNLKWK